MPVRVWQSGLLDTSRDRNVIPDSKEVDVKPPDPCTLPNIDLRTSLVKEHVLGSEFLICCLHGVPLIAQDRHHGAKDGSVPDIEAIPARAASCKK